MKAKLLVGGTLTAALLISGVTLGTGSAYAATTAAAPKVQIMLAGDSITEGVDGDYTWRYRLFEEFKRQGVLTSVNLVGPRNNPKGGRGNYLGGRTWDYNHFGIGGTTLHEQVANIAEQVDKYKPDVLISYLSTNDFLEIPRTYHGRTDAEMLVLYRARTQRVLADWRDYIAEAKSKNQGIKIVLGELVTPKIPQVVRDEYNAGLADLAEELSANPLSSFRIEIAQLNSSLWTSPLYLYDRIHPAPTGETVLAQHFAEKLAAVTSNATSPYGLFKRQPAIQRNVAWNPPLRPRVKTVGQRVQLDWSFSARYNSAQGMRTKFYRTKSAKSAVRAKGAKNTVTPFRAVHQGTTWTSPKLKPGTYRFQVQASRVSMVSTWSPVYVVKIKKPDSPTSPR